MPSHSAAVDSPRLSRSAVQRRTHAVMSSSAGGAAVCLGFTPKSSRVRLFRPATADFSAATSRALSLAWDERVVSVGMWIVGPRLPPFNVSL